MGHPDGFPLSPAAELPDQTQSEALGELGERQAQPGARPCVVCREELGAGERRVHAGACARQRKTALQKLRRRRARA